MTQLTALDANFLNVECGGTLTHIGGLGILDTTQCAGGRLTLDDLLELVKERAYLAKPLHRRLVEVPFGIDRPYWVDDPDFDPRHHVHEVTLPPPGDERQLSDEIARLHQIPLDRRRPLWELYLVQGLADGRAAIYIKVHHAAIDGVLAAETLAAFLDLSPQPRIMDVPRREPERAPGALAMLGAGLVKTFLHPVRSARSLVRTAPYLDEIPLFGQYPGVNWVSRAIHTVIGQDSGARPRMPRMSAPPTPFNGPISGHRRFAYGSLPLDDIKQVCKILDASVNDVVMGLCATALRRWLIKHDALPDQPLIAVVPVSLRQRIGGDDGGNRLSVMIAPLPTHLEDPKERFDAVGQTMRMVKRRFITSSGNWLHEVSGLVPASIASLATRTTLQLIPHSLLRGVNLMVSNVPGPQIPLYVRGARVLGYYPVSVISDITGGLNITVFSYNGNVDIGIIADPQMVPDVSALLGYLGDALDELKEIAGIM